MLIFLFEAFKSQIKIFIDLIGATTIEKDYEIININNQELSKKISFLFSFFNKNFNEFNSENSEGKKIFTNLQIKSFINNINIKSNLNSKNYSNKQDSIIQLNSCYDKDEESHINDEKVHLIKTTNNLISTFPKKQKRKNSKNNYSIPNINNQNKSFNKKQNTKINERKNILNKNKNKNHLPYNLNINIYSNKTNDNFSNSLKINNYRNYYHLNENFDNKSKYNKDNNNIYNEFNRK